MYTERKTKIRIMLVTFTLLVITCICYLLDFVVADEAMSAVIFKTSKIFMLLSLVELLRFVFAVCDYLQNMKASVISTVAFGITVFASVCLMLGALPVFIDAVGYGLLFSSVILLGVKAYHEPKMYRLLHISLMLSILAAFAIHVFCKYLVKNITFDASCIFIAIECIIIFIIWNQYSKRKMFGRDGIRVLDVLGKGIVLFDYNDNMVTCSKDAEFMVNGKADNYSLHEFIKDNGLDEYISDESTSMFFWWKYENKLHENTTYRVEFNVLRDTQCRIVGKLFVITKEDLSKDRLTGFLNQTEFMSVIKKPGFIEKYPASLAVFDINRLASINESMGADEGDKAIMALALAMKQHLPENTVFARMANAVLVAVSPELPEEEMREAADCIKKEMVSSKKFIVPIEIQSSVYVITLNSMDISSVVKSCIESMRARKMMDHTSAHSSLIDSLVQIQYEVDPSQSAHIARIKTLSTLLGKRMELSDKQLGELQLLCLVHDIGLVGVPLYVINKPGRLTNQEWSLMMSHVEKGYRIASASQELSPIATYILHHHECWNGSGYPDGLSQDSIPLLSRIIAIVDTYDAMINDRPYRKALPAQKARENLQKDAGVMFDPDIVQEFIEMLSEMSSADSLNEGEKGVSEYDMAMEPMGAYTVKNRDASDGMVFKVPYSEYLLDGDNYIVKVDGTFEALTGYSFEDVRETHLKQFDLIFPEDLDEYSAYVSEIFSSEDTAYLAHRLRRKEGSVRYVFCYGTKYYDSVNKKAMARIIITDVTDAYDNQRKLNKIKGQTAQVKKESSDRLQRDEVTGILGSNGFMNEVDYLLMDENVAPVFMIIAVDKYLSKLEEYGQDNMNDIMIVITKGLKNSLPERSIIGKIRSDEFGVIVPCTKSNVAQNASYLVSEVWGLVMSYLDGDGYNISITLSGVWTVGTGNGFNELFKASTKLLLKSKATESGAYVLEEI